MESFLSDYIQKSNETERLINIRDVNKQCIVNNNPFLRQSDARNTLDEIENELKTAMSVMKLLNGECQMPIEDIKYSFMKCLLKFKRDLLKEIKNSSNEYMPRTLETTQFIRRWLTGQDSYPQSVCLTSLSMQQTYSRVGRDQNLFMDSQMHQSINTARNIEQLRLPQQQCLSKPETAASQVARNHSLFMDSQMHQSISTARNIEQLRLPQQQCMSKPETEPPQARGGVEDNSYVSSSTRLVVPKLKYWEVGNRLVENCSVISSKDDNPVKLKSAPAINKSVLRDVTIRETKKVGDSEFKVPLATKIKTPGAKPKRSLSSPPLESKKLNTKLKTTTLKESIRNERKRSLSSSPPKPKDANAKTRAKGLKEPNGGHAKQTCNSNRTTENKNATVSLKNNNEFGEQKKVTEMKCNKENLPLGETKSMENLTKTKAKNVQSRGRKRKSSENETDSANTVKELGHGVENNSYISSRGRLVVPKLKYWEVGRRPVENCSVISLEDDIQVKLKNPPAVNKSRDVSSARERKKIDDSEFKVPLETKIKTSRAKPKRSLSTPPLESKTLSAKLKTTTLNKNIGDEGKQNLSSSFPKSNNVDARKTAKELKESNSGRARRTSNSNRATENKNVTATVKNNNEFEEVKKKITRRKNNKENLPLKETKSKENLTKTKAGKLQSRGRKRKSSENETDSAKTVKELDEGPKKNVDDNLFEESFQLYGSVGASNGFGFEVPSPEDVLKSIRKKNAPCSGRETPPTKYMCSFLDRTDKTLKTPTVLSEDEHKNVVKNHAAERVGQKIKNPKGKDKQNKQKNSRQKSDMIPEVEQLITKVLHLDGQTPKKIKQTFRPKLTNDDSLNSWEDPDDYSDLC